ncbi:MAG: methionine/alanine import family NSS transporter small subunit [Alysiella sp.]|nr:methionine/alanine import family NSS transporter small subunit [Alysiella sp.]MDO4434299.1 methionine/alanine import family NSS transporter small subunit [Alysiella sp.]
MSGAAILMMAIAMAIIWGGLVAAIVRLPKEEQDQ